MALPEQHLPSYLGNIEPAGAPLARGAQAGASIASSILNRKRFQIEKAEAEQRMREMQESNPILRRINEQNMALGAIKLSDYLKQREIQTGIAATGAVASSEVTDAMVESRLNDYAPDSVRNVHKQLERYSSILRPWDPNSPWHQRIDTFDKEVADSAKWKAAQKTTLEAARIRTADSETPTIDTRREQEADVLMQQAEAARQVGNVELYQQLTERANNRLAKTKPPSGQTIDVTMPGGAAVRVSSGGVQPTTATQTVAQKKLISAENASRLIGNVLPQINLNTVGPIATVKNFTLDKAVGAFIPGVVDPERVDARSTLGHIREEVLRQISDDPDNRFSESDRRTITDLVNGLQFNTNPDDVRIRLQNTQNILRDRSRTWAERTGTPIPDFTKSVDEVQSDYERQNAAIRKSVLERRITKQQGQAELDAAFERLTRALRDKDAVPKVQ